MTDTEFKIWQMVMGSLIVFGLMFISYWTGRIDEFLSRFKRK